MQRRLAQLLLHGGKAPAYLFQRMTKLAGAMTMAIVDEYGTNEMLRRLADPRWFQASGCVLGFDRHSSGVTTVTCGALKEAQKKLGNDLGIFVAGGKGAASRKTPREISDVADRNTIKDGDKLIYASRMSAKVDSAAVQDGYQLYHHSFFFEATDKESVRKYQSEKFGATDSGFASLELFSLPSINAVGWIYGEITELPYLINREVYQYYLYPRRAKELRRRIQIHKSKRVIIYSKGHQSAWEGIIMKKFESFALPQAVETMFESTCVIVIPHSAAFGNDQSYWVQAGEYLKNTT